MGQEDTTVKASQPEPKDEELKKIAPKASEPREPRDPFKAFLQAVVRDMKTDETAARLQAELKAQGITSIADLTPDKVGEARRAIAAALGLDGHALVAAAQRVNKEG